MYRTSALLAAAALVGLAPAAAPAQFDQIDVAFREKAPAVIAFAKKQGYGNVGVLKFLVSVGEAPPSDDVGELNMGLADRLELALILANPNEQLGILHRASAQVVRNSNLDANHLDREGRKAFYLHPYELAWGSEKVKPGGFITGTAALSKDLSTVTIRLQAFGRDGELVEVPDGTFTAPTTARVLTESGRSFYLAPAEYQKALDGARGVPKHLRNKVVAAKQVEEHEAFLEQTQKEPDRPVKIPALAEGPVRLTVILNGSVVEIVNGRAPEPKAGDRLAFELANRSKDTCAVVLKVNGESTLGRGRGDPWFNQKWVLGPGEKVKIDGFFVENDKIDEFRILPPEESDAAAVRYGDNAGTFRMTVWKGTVAEKTSEDIDADVSEDERSLMAISRGAIPTTVTKPQTLRSLQAALRRPTRDVTGARGLVVGGQKKGGGETQEVRFQADSSIPVAEAVIRYYEPKPAGGPKVAK